MEEPLPRGGSCLLGSINLAEFVSRPYTDTAEFNEAEFEYTVRTAVRALNDVLDEGLPLHPLQEQRDSVREWRQIGLGFMGLADMLIKMKITYGSETAIHLSNAIVHLMFRIALDESERLGVQYGSYPMFDEEAVNQSEMLCGHLIKHLRNSQLLTIPPTGTLSSMIRVSGGAEPIFANSYTRKTQSLHGEDVFYKVYTPIVQDYMERYGIADESELPPYFVTAHDIAPIDRVKMQAALQEWIDASISSTINLPNAATIEDVENIYMEAWKHGLKGVTVYRAGCAREPILDVGDATIQTEEVLPRGYVIPSNDNLIGLKRKLMTGCGSLHCMAYFDKDTHELRETYLSKGSTGGCNNFMVGLSRLISTSARGGISLESIVDQLDSTGVCPSYATRRAKLGDTSPGSCCPMAVGKALLDMQEELGQIDPKPNCTPYKASVLSGDKFNNATCPECGEPLIFEGGCNVCKNCGWSKCN